MDEGFYIMTNIVIIILTLACIIIPIISMWKIFEKAGEPGWAALVPFMSQYKLCKISLGNGWLFLLAFLPLINFILAIMVAIKLSGAFGKGIGFVFGLIFLPFIFYMILGFGSATYLGNDIQRAA